MTLKTKNDLNPEEKMWRPQIAERLRKRITIGSDNESLTIRAFLTKTVEKYLNERSY